MAAAYRIPHSTFLGWSKSDRDKALWHHVRERSRCDRCGTRADEWDESKGGHRHAYAAELARCRGCEVIESKREAVSKQAKQLGRGIYLRLTRAATRR